jgi:hypothetical protein
MPDEFDQSLEQLIKSTIDLYEESAATQYFPMMRCARGDEIRYVLLAPEDDDFVEPDDWTEFFRSAAENAARLRRPAPDILSCIVALPQSRRRINRHPRRFPGWPNQRGGTAGVPKRTQSNPPNESPLAIQRSDDSQQREDPPPRVGRIGGLNIPSEAHPHAKGDQVGDPPP